VLSVGNLRSYVTRVSKLKETEARGLAQLIASAVNYCHFNNIVHGDLKLENIMMDNASNVKIIDFGLSSLYSLSRGRKLSRYCGTVTYATPELLLSKPYTGPKVDVWSFGVVIFHLVCSH
ncbi:kinase-like domain-containing protein, partial [Podospora didyma]